MLTSIDRSKFNFRCMLKKSVKLKIEEKKLKKKKKQP